MTSLICMRAGKHLSLMIVKKETHIIGTSDIGRHRGLMASAVVIPQFHNFIIFYLYIKVTKFNEVLNL